MKQCQKHMVFRADCFTCRADAWGVDVEDFYQESLNEIARLLDTDSDVGSIFSAIDRMKQRETNMKKMIAQLRHRKDNE